MKTSQEVVRMKRGQAVPVDRLVRIDARDERDFCLDPLKVAIARFSDDDIRRMSHSDLYQCLECSGAFSGREWPNSLTLMDLDELRRLVDLARHFCRQAVNDAYRRHQRQILFQNDKERTE